MVALNCWTEPTSGISRTVWLTETSPTLLLTVTRQLADSPLEVRAVTVAGPTPCAVTMPPSETVTTLVLLLLQRS